MSRVFKVTLAVLALGVVLGGIYLRGLRQRVMRLARPTHTEERARREVIQPSVAAPADATGKAKIFWATEQGDRLEPVEIEIPLSADPAHRAKRVLDALITSPPAPARRTLPADAALLEFYLLPDGTAIADFSDALSRATPSGIGSEQQAVDSIARTLEANVAGARRLRILINGQPAETLAGHVDLTGFFPLQPAQPALTPPGAPGKLGR